MESNINEMTFQEYFTSILNSLADINIKLLNLEVKMQNIEQQMLSLRLNAGYPRLYYSGDSKDSFPLPPWEVTCK